MNQFSGYEPVPMAKWKAKHWAVLVALLTALATQLSALDHGWHEAVTPQFLSGLMLQIATTLAALFTGPPRKQFTRRSDRPSWETIRTPSGDR
jgi:hypothetical protein